MSLGVPPRELAMGKALGITWALGVLLVPATIVGVSAIGLASGPAELLGESPRMVMMGAGYLLYFGAVLALSLAVSRCQDRRGRLCSCSWASGSSTA